MLSVHINERVRKIKDNDEEINRLIEEYKPFIASCVEKSTGRYVRYGDDDELSIALMAFVEAVKSYNIFKGSFLSFAQNVIKRRLVDYYRKEKKHNGMVSLNAYLDENDEEKDLSIGKSVEIYANGEINEYRRLELEDLKKQLSKWDISFLELAEVSPKHDKTRRIYGSIVRFLLSRTDLIEYIMNKKHLPVAEIEKCLGVPRKTIERARKYIMAVIIILTGDYQYIRDYAKWR